VAPESNAQIIDGRLRLMPGAHEGHALEHTEVALLLRGCLAPGYRVAIDMLTRMTRTTDAAPDVSVFPVERDAKTGGRKLEEIAFEVLDAESEAHVTAKAEKLAKRGVRRLFYVRVGDHAVFEWSHDDAAWRVLTEDAVITDRCFTVPVPARALANEILANNTVAEALLRGRNAVIEAAMAARERDGRIAGERNGRIEQARVSLLRVLARRALQVSDAQRAQIAACDDAATLERWLDRAIDAASASDVLA
jgi:hypothetical protein